MILWLVVSAITMDEAVERALRNHPEVRMARASAAVARAQIAVEGALPQPEFRLSTNNFDLDTLTLKERTSVGLRWSPPRLKEVSLKTAMARVKQRAVEATIAQEEQRVGHAVRLAYRRAAVAGERVKVAERVLQLRREKRQAVAAQVKAGVKESEQLELAEFGVEEAMAESGRVQQMARAEKQALERLVGEAVELEAAGAVLAVPEAEWDAERLVELAGRERGDVEALRQSCRQFTLARQLARQGLYPWVSFVQVSHRVTPIADRGPWGWQVGVDLPVFRTRARAEAQLAAAQQARCEVEEEALRRQVRLEVEGQAAALEQMRRELRDLERLRAGAGERALEKSRAALARGLVEVVDVLEAEARVLGLRERWMQKRLEYLVVESQLERAVGRDVTEIAR